MMNVTLRKAILLAFALPQVTFFAVAESSTNDDTEVMDVYGTGYTRPLTIDKPGETLVTQEKIEIEQPTNIAELFEDIPGVSFDGGARAGGERISIWGFSDPSDLGVYVDGAPIGFEQYRYGSFFFDPYLIGEAEVTKGAHDVQAGSKFGGTIRIRTKSVDELLKAGRKVGARIHLGYNDNDDQTHIGVTAFGKADNGIYALASGTWKDANDIRVGGGDSLEYSAYSQNNGLFKIGYENAVHLFEISHTFYSDEGRQPWATRRGAFTKISDYNIRKYGSLEAAKYAYTVQNEYKDKTTSARYSYNPSSPLVNLKITAAHSDNERHWRRPDVAWKKMFVSIGAYGHESWASYQRDYVDINNEMKIGRHTITAGLQYERNNRDTLVHNATKIYNKPKKNYGIFIPYYDPSGTQTTYSAYLADKIEVTDRFRVTPSLRYDYVTSKGKENPAPDYNDPAAGHDYSKVSHAGFSPRIQLDYDLTDQTLLNFAYAYQMKAPSVDDIYAVQYARAKASATARELEAQRIHAYRASMINSLSGLFANKDMLSTEITGFYNDVTNNVMNRTGVNLDSDPNTLQSWKVNLDGYRNYGVDVQAQYRVAAFFADISASYIAGKHKGSLTDSSGEDQYMYGIPPMSVKLGLGYEWIKGLTTGYKLRWYDAQENVEDSIYFAQASEQYTLQDIYVSWQPQAHKDLMLRATVKNIADVYYEPYLSNGVPGPGREVRLSMTYDF
ncbi:TonB-dependent receptor domain-containing protein [Vibrio mediterranei]|uniref:TonB-dependent receptor domain-containing protein n=1 Tax=Vibrio mediterranei TaxID=689 RepID=UPI00228451C4|nr:TonB-dependent receptor [Vibrio mediterranei]MCY9852527.1 TonB-dependent receptor [Vibrio mediterranei]